MYFLIYFSSAILFIGIAPGKAIIPTMGQSVQFRSNLWLGLEKLMETITTVCMNAYQLHKV